MRARVLSHLETIIAVSEKHQVLPAFRATARALLEAVRTRWPEAKQLELYPAFKK